MRIIGSINLNSEIHDKINVNMKPSYVLLHKKLKCHWNIELETLFQQIKTSNTKEFTPTLANTNHLFFILVDSSWIGIGFALLQMIDDGKPENI